MGGRVFRDALSCLALATALSSVPLAATAGTWRVNVDRTGGAPTIQAALEMARDDTSAEVDTVLVAPGRYTWSNQGTGNEYGMIRYWKSEMDDVHLVSEGGPSVTFLDAESRGRVFFANGNNIVSDPVEFVVDGFSLVNGVAPPYENRLEREGGAMAMHLVYPVIRNCVFRNNQAEYGGAVWLGGVAGFRFENCRFVNNHAVTTRPGVAVFGGALYVVNSPELTVFERCEFVNNRTAYRGGGALVVNARVDFVDCLFAENSSTDVEQGNGTALYLFDVHEVNLERVLIRDNDTSTGPALLIREVQNAAMQVHVRDSVIAFNPPGQGVRVTADATFSCTNIYGHPLGNWTGSLLSQLGRDGNLSVDPLFCAEAYDRRAVDVRSPMLASGNDCGRDLGGVVAACGVWVRSFEGSWMAEGAEIRVEIELPSVGAQAPALERSADGVDPVLLDTGWPATGGALRHLDATAPADGALYRLLDFDGQELARFRLGPRVPLPPGVAVLGAYPNPFNPGTVIHWSLPAAGHARVRILDSRGREVFLLHEGPASEGDNAADWRGVDRDGRPLASGVYLVEVVSGGERGGGKVTLVR